jgi:hypothetical protein
MIRAIFIASLLFAGVLAAVDSDLMASVPVFPMQIRVMLLTSNREFGQAISTHPAALESCIMSSSSQLIITARILQLPSGSMVDQAAPHYSVLLCPYLRFPARNRPILPRGGNQIQDRGQADLQPQLLASAVPSVVHIIASRCWIFHQYRSQIRVQRPLNSSGQLRRPEELPCWFQ